MTERKRPSAKNILDGVVRAMYDAQEPLDNDLALVPANYEVYLHPEAYQELQSLMARIKEQVQRRLDQELARMNGRSKGGTNFLKRLFQPVLRFLFADRYLHGDTKPTTFERSSEAWSVEFTVTAEQGVHLDYLAIETDFGNRKKVAYKGRPTINIRRRTMMLPNGQFETVLSANRPRPTRERKTMASSQPTSASVGVLARLSYEDNSGRHIYYMKKEQIVVGRQDRASRPLDIALKTLPDVSREHLWIRYDQRTGEFTVKDLSQYGSTVNGSRVQSSLNPENEDLNSWHPLPPNAEIGLANAVFIQFEALNHVNTR